MPLPDGNTPWPPPAWTGVYQAYRSWDAWYSGDTDRLAAVYQTAERRTVRPSQRAGGVVGAVARFFWGTPPPTHERSPKLHIPAAGDIAGASADLLFAQPPTVRIDDPDRDPDTQQRLDTLLGEDTMTLLTEAAEVASALGGVYLRAGWDRDVSPDRPVPSVVHPDAAVPTFRWGQLVEVTFHRVVDDDGTTVVRHLEHHAPGRVEHALYVGDRDRLGRRVPLTEHPATEGYAPDLAGDGQSIPTGIDGLDVVYVPNVRPTRRWRNDPVAASLGRSDLDGVEPLMDALDETYTAWMRDIRLAKARLLVPSAYLDNHGRGEGASFDADREVFTPLDMLVKDGSGITANQFAIRHEEHRATAQEWWEMIVRGAGYSAQTFGLSGEVAMTATESNAKERRTNLTRGKKVRHWRTGLARFAEALLGIDRAQFGSRVEPQRPGVEFPPATVETARERAETTRLLHDADAASIETRVRMVHPDWSDEQVSNEVAALTESRADPPSMRM